MVLTFESVAVKSLRVTPQVKVTEQCFPLVLFIMINKVVLTLESVCDHSNESY